MADAMPDVISTDVQETRHPVRPTWNPAEEALRRAEMERAAQEQLDTKKGRRGRKQAAATPEPTMVVPITKLVRGEHIEPVHEPEPGHYHSTFVARAVCITGFFLAFAFPAVLLLLNHFGHADLVDGAFEPDLQAQRVLTVVGVGAAACMLLGWLWWGVAAALNARHKARWAVSPWYVPLTYVAVAAAAIGAGMSERWLGENDIYAKACALAFAVLMYFNTLGTYRSAAEAVGAPTKYFTRLIVVPWVVAAAAGVFAFFSRFVAGQVLLGVFVLAQLVQGLYGLTMYQAMASMDRACVGTRMMRQDDQEFAKFLKRGR